MKQKCDGKAAEGIEAIKAYYFYYYLVHGECAGRLSARAKTSLSPLELDHLAANLTHTGHHLVVNVHAALAAAGSGRCRLRDQIRSDQWLVPIHGPGSLGRRAQTPPCHTVAPSAIRKQVSTRRRRAMARSSPPTRDGAANASKCMYDCCGGAQAQGARSRAYNASVPAWHTPDDIR